MALESDKGALVETKHNDSAQKNTAITFEQLGVMSAICATCEKLNYAQPTEIQREAIPLALSGRDIIGLAQTGSGKTASFSIPVLQALWEKPSPLFAVVLTPTRELAMQVAEQIEALGADIGAKCAVIVGGMDMMTQAIALSRKPHLIVATPGRLQDHLEHTKGFNLKSVKYLVLDEADKLLDMDFGPSIDKILQNLPRERHTYLYSATMTTKVEKLQRASLSNPARVSVATKYSTVSTLIQSYLFFPFKYKETYLVYLAHELSGQTMIIFSRTCNDTTRISLILRHFGFGAVPLHGQLSQNSRISALNKFKAGSKTILCATDVAARGLDIPTVDCVINFDIPTDSKSYIHRVGRTARAGRAGKAISLVTQYDLELFLRIEAALGTKLEEYKIDKDAALAFMDSVDEAGRAAALEIKEMNESKHRKGRKDDRSNKRRRIRDDMDKETV